MFTKKIIPTFNYRSEAFDYRFSELILKGKDAMESARDANEFADIIAKNKNLPDAPPKPMNGIDKGLMYLKQISVVKKENPEVWELLTSVAGGILGGFSGGSLALEEPQTNNIDFNNLD
jgi:hypothetical protein